MPSLISVRVCTIGELFSQSAHFRLPWFQRAYAWQTRQVARLLGDLLEAMSKPGAGSEFLLGTLYFATAQGQPGFAIVNGHQRNLTLTILFAVLRDLDVDGPLSLQVAGFISVEGATPHRYKLSPQPRLAEFLRVHVQDAGATMVEPMDDAEDDLSDCERNILEVRDFIRSRLGDGKSGSELRANLFDFLSHRCRVVVHEFDDEAEAWRAFNVESDTTVELDMAADAKATILAVMAPEERLAASRKWEACEHKLGPARLGDLLLHIRTLKSRKRLDNPVQNDICMLFALDRDASAFTDGWLVPYANHYAVLEAAIGGRGPLPEDARDGVVHLSWIDGSLWRPAALRWIETRGSSHSDGPLFFRRLERLVWMMRLAGIDPPLQRSRMIAVANDIDDVSGPEDMRSLEIEAALRRDATVNLRAQNFCKKAHAPAVLRRLSKLLGSDPGPVHKETLTIEHVLPRNPPRNRNWWVHFKTKNSIAEHMHRLGNLTFLSQSDNQLAETHDWPDKRPILERSAFTLSQQAAETPEWNRQAILSRTEVLIKILFKAWDLAD